MTYIISHRNGYYVGIVRNAEGKTLMYRFSVNAFDAKRYQTANDARTVAKRIGGKTVVFDPLHGIVDKPT